jgi:hypothetical protein
MGTPIPGIVEELDKSSLEFNVIARTTGNIETRIK